METTLFEDSIFKGKFGIERETLRVTLEGKLAQTPHPFLEETLSRDFCENQLEIITPVCDTIKEAMDSLEKISEKAEKYLLQQNERLWMCSNPPHFDSEDELPIAQYDGAQIDKHTYRIKLERRYGKQLMLYCGIHFNVSFPESMMHIDKNDFYMKLLKYATRYSWLPTLLTAASPIYDASLDCEGSRGSSFDGAGSMRNSKRGYWNQFVPVLDYRKLETYCDSVQRYIDKGALFSEGELYMPVRIKSKGQNSLKQLRKDGVDHIELRMFDINPLFPLGIAMEDLQFAYLLLLYFAGQEDFDFTEEMQIESIENHQKAARFDLSDVQIGEKGIIDFAKEMLLCMQEYFKGDKEAVEVIEQQGKKLQDGKRYTETVYEQQKDHFEIPLGVL